MLTHRVHNARGLQKGEAVYDVNLSHNTKYVNRTL